MQVAPHPTRARSTALTALVATVILMLVAALVPQAASAQEAGDPPGARPAGELLRLDGPERIATAAAVADALFEPGVPVVYIARQDEFPDALTGGPALAALGAPVLLVTDVGVPPPTASALERLAPSDIRVLGGTDAVPDVVVGQLAAFTSGQVDRIAGPTRFETAAEIALERFTPDATDTVYVATGLNWPDALAGSAAAGAEGAPILLVATDAVPAATSDAIATLSPSRILIMGGTEAISTGVEATLASSGATVERISGPTRFETAAAIADASFPDSDAIYITTGLNFPDALAGGPPAAIDGAPILLVTPDAIPPATLEQIERLAGDEGLGRIVILGGTAAVGSVVEEQLQGFLRGGVPGDFEVELSWFAEVDDEQSPPLFAVGQPNAEGFASLSVDLDANEIAFEIDYSDVDGPFAGGPGAHLHEGGFDENGPVVVFFATGEELDAGDGFISGTVSGGDDFDVADVIADETNYYVNIHSDAFPAGAIRGQLPTGVPEIETATSTWEITATPEQVVDGGGQPGASGTYNLTFDSVNEIVCYDISVTGLTSAAEGGLSSPAFTANHIHQAPAGVAGPPRVLFPDLTPIGDANPSASGCHYAPTITGTGGDVDNGAGFSLAQIEANPADYYVDVHTVDNPAGAVRGQFTQTTTDLAIDLSWFAEVDDTATPPLFATGQPNAEGSAQLSLDPVTGDVSYSIEYGDVDGPFTGFATAGAHIHEGAPDQNGPVELLLATGDELSAGGGSVSGTVSAAPTLVQAMIADPGSYYVNLHSEPFPVGAIRGQLPTGVPEIETATSTWQIMATPEQVVDGGGQPGASGTYNLTFDSVNEIVCYDISVTGLTSAAEGGGVSSPAKTANHIHEAGAGVAGPPRVLFPDLTPIGDEDVAASGCHRAPTETGTGGDVDNGAGFSLAQIEADPADYYVDIHTVNNPAGAVRGQFVQVDTPPPGGAEDYEVELSWFAEVDDEASPPLFAVGQPNAEGFASLTVDADANTIDFEIDYSDVDGPFAGGPGAHLHEGGFDENGPVVVFFATGEELDAGDGFISGTVSGGDDFDVADVIADETNYYVNIHSDAFPAGAIRGQLPTGVPEITTPTSTWEITATPEEVVDGGGQDGASGTYTLTFDSVNEIVCYDISVTGLTSAAEGGGVSSPAKTANHIHEAAAGVAGPPRVLFPDLGPIGDADVSASGCHYVPNETGTGGDVDNGAGFSLAQIEANPADYYVDIHTVDNPAGAVRGQFTSTDADVAAASASVEVLTASTSSESSPFLCHLPSDA